MPAKPLAADGDPPSDPAAVEQELAPTPDDDDDDAHSEYELPERSAFDA